MIDMLLDVLKALGIVGAVALLLGVALALLNKYFGVEEDGKKREIRACLPGINCGACGFKGCDDYAAALAEGGAKPNLCIPGAEGVCEELSGILGIEVEPPKDEVAFVACNGTCEATSNKAVYDGISTCRAASMVYGGPEKCLYGCMGYGDCAAVCPSGAISVVDGLAKVDTSLCVGCRLCTETCPKNIITMVPQEAMVVVMCNNKDKGADARKACANACIACRKCEKICPSGAITVEDNLAHIDYGKCVRCGKCAEVCPTHCLKNVFFPDLPEGFEVKV